MKSFLTSVFFISVLLLVSGMRCTKPGSSITGGKGGGATLVVTPVHLALNVDSCTIYIKYAAVDAPANGIYDDSQKVHLSDTTPVAIFAGLKKGEYYIFGDGYHAVYYSYVKGGIPITITAEDSNFVLLPTSAYVK